MAHLYAMRAIDPVGHEYGPIKIGHTADLPRRQAEVRAWLPAGHDLHTIHRIPGSLAGVQRLEAQLHHQLDHHRLPTTDAPRGSREWFACTAEVIDALAQLQHLARPALSDLDTLLDELAVLVPQLPSTAEPQAAAVLTEAVSALSTLARRGAA